ncbi:sugar ABC transporter substrate-binding protein [Oceaniovalibus sp. ACAM 378]|uniref:ABC transporter substrate-binding protein n=1 Tax=Oceaniovalibus sp. ACAM 378 TaxID=2599923 RepID=UPI0011DA89B2|nr:sugar ABC transporter substrate-binding protein [Oceaniovalibus sp. ACAM 378]TYB85730.1 sugar ABC transporter substrate-binding protein [Oceaniovalibus sp. ACAM 378]
MNTKQRMLGTTVGLGLMAGLASVALAEEITIATVNNGDMVRMQSLSPQWEKDTGNTINWVVLEENVLRQNVTTDISTGGGQYDVMTIGTYEAPIWGNNGWLVSLNEGMADDWNADDLLPAIRGGLTVDGELVAAPFYGESSMVMYRKDLMEKAGLEMPEAPTWDFIREAAAAMTDRDNEINGICARGKAGWGENMAFLTAMSNSFGARWFDMDWAPQFESEAWSNTLNFYLDMMKESGPAGAANNGFNENLTLFQQGKCGMWIDATVAASFVTNPKDSTVADQVGFALAPDTGLGKRGNWLWAWSLAIPTSSEKQDVAKDFVSWATGQGYTALVAENEGWANVPPGTRTSLYENQDYLDAAPFAQMTLNSINSADPQKPTVEEVPYTGVQFVAIPEFAGIANQVGQQFSNALAGNQTAEEALENAQALTLEEMEAAGY